MREPVVEARPIPVEASRPIRHAVLRPGRPVEELVFAEDDAPGTLHVGGFVDGELVSVGRLSRESPPARDDPDAWRLRGMATLEGFRGLGAGRAVLARCIEHAIANGGTEVWCNARTGARGFYERAGFRAEGEPFDIPGIGPHFLMQLALGGR